MIESLKLSELKDLEVYKYVRIGDEFRFCMVYPCSHIDLVSVHEKAVSAGLIGLRPGVFSILDQGSSTLKLYGILPDDVVLLEKLLNRKEVKR